MAHHALSFVLALALLSFACGEPTGKTGENNGSTNNGSTNNGSTNNGSANNGSGGGSNSQQSCTYDGDCRSQCPEDDCGDLLPVCASGTCGLRERVYVDASTWDKTCERDEECIIIHEGEVCSACKCGGTGVNESELPRYEELTDVDCNPGPDMCDCPTIDSAWCNEGTCEAGSRP